MKTPNASPAGETIVECKICKKSYGTSLAKQNAGNITCPDCGTLIDMDDFRLRQTEIQLTPTQPD